MTELRASVVTPGTRKPARVATAPPLPFEMTISRPMGLSHAASMVNSQRPLPSENNNYGRQYPRETASGI